MIKILIKTKLLSGTHVEVREYEMFKHDLKVIHCTDKDYKTHDHILDPYMVLSLAKQKKGKVVNTLQSKFPPYSYYRMYKFLFKPIIPKSFDDEYIFKDGKAIQI